MACRERTPSEILKREGCDDAGQPLDPTSLRTKTPIVMATELVAEAIDACHLTAAERAEVERNPGRYEQPTETVNISVDDVVVTQQKPSRTNTDEEHETAAGEEKSHGRPSVHNTVAHLHHQEQSSCLTGQSVPAVLRMVLGYLLANVLLGGRLQFFVDGQKTLQASILRAFAWFSTIGMILDWYHRKDTCARQLSLAMKGAA